MTSQEINKRFAKLAGICWHESNYPEGVTGYQFVCLKCKQLYNHNPDFCADPREVLKVLEDKFMLSQFLYSFSWDSPYFFMQDYILDTTGKAALAAIEWMEKQE